MRRTVPIAALGALLLASSSHAASVDVSVVDQSGHPLPDAIVELIPAASQPPAPTALAQESIVDQRRETFFPLVSLVPMGGDIVFTNHDTTMHQVYSFSAIKQFALEVDQGQRSRAVVFEKPGIAAIGCNIHDQMITYVYVARSPWTVRTDASGYARIATIPPGSYRATIWHPHLPAGQAPSVVSLVVAGDRAELKAGLPVHGSDQAPKKSKHMDMY
jgi:plastocyanin